MKMPWHVLFENRLMFKYTNIVEYKISLGNRIYVFLFGQQIISCLSNGQIYIHVVILPEQLPCKQFHFEHGLSGLRYFAKNWKTVTSIPTGRFVEFRDSTRDSY